MRLKNHYKILRVSENADIAQIKAAYRKLARKYHPDVSKEANAETIFKEIAETYAVLKDPEKRAEYDQLLAVGAKRIDGRFRQPQGWRANTEFSKSRSTQADERYFSDFFESIIDSAQRANARDEQPRSFHVRGLDIHHKLSLPLAAAQHGGQQQISLRIPAGDESGTAAHREKTLNVKIPAGVTQGQRIRIAGQGAPGLNGGEPGDLFLEIELVPPPHFGIDGKNILLTLPVTDWETTVGATVEVPTLNGKVKLKIPPGSSSGNRLRIKGKGLAGTPPGDQLVTLDVVETMLGIINSWRYDVL